MDNRNKEPRTIREKLEAIANFRPAMQGGSSLSTYVPAQPNTIGRDPLVGSDIGRLVDALRPWDKALDRAYEAHIDRRILEDKASAELFKVEHPGMTKNIEAFRQAALDDPNVLNLSPHVKKAIEGEILKGNAIQFAASLEDAYSTSDIRNERDPAKVMAWSEEQRKLYMQQQGLDKYDDKFMLAEHFAHPTARMLEGILARHSKDVESQNANLLEQQKAQNIQNILAMKQDLTSPLGGRDTKIPSDRVAYAQEAASAIMGEVEDMKRLGYSQDRLMGFLGKVVLHGSHSARTARQLAQAIMVDVNGQKVSLMSQPGNAKGIEQLEDGTTFPDKRLNTFTDICDELNIKYDGFIIQDKFSTSSGYKMMSEMISKGNLPTAIFAASDPIAIGAMRALQENGYKIPEDISVMGFDNTELSGYTNPPLTTVNAPVYAMGIYGIRFILNMMKSKSTDYYSPMRVYLPCPIKVRNSCAKPKKL